MPNLSEITVAILAGGLGTRLANTLPGQQKVVAKVREYPFLEYILSQLNKAGFWNVVICTGYLSDQVEKALSSSYKSLKLNFSKEPSPLGTAGAIRLALSNLESEDILVTNGDSFLDINLKKLWKFHNEKGANGTIALTEVSDTSRYGRVELDENDQIVSFEEKKENRGAGYINGGIYIFKRSLLLEIPEDKNVSFEKDMFPKWIKKGLCGFKSKGKFIDIGTPQSYKMAEEFFSQNAK